MEGADGHGGHSGRLRRCGEEMEQMVQDAVSPACDGAEDESALGG